MPTTPSQVAAAVRAEIARAGLSHRKLAAAMGINRGVLHRRLNGTVRFRADELQAIADYLGVPVSRFYDPLPAPTQLRPSVPEQPRTPNGNVA